MCASVFCLKAVEVGDVDRAAMICQTYAAYCSANIAGFTSSTREVRLEKNFLPALNGVLHARGHVLRHHYNA